MQEAKHWSQRLHDALAANIQPTADLLEEAVASLLEERKAKDVVINDLTALFAKLIHARKSDDTEAILSALDKFIAAKVVVVRDEKGVVH